MEAQGQENKKLTVLERSRKWRDENRERYREMCRRGEAKWRAKNRERLREKDRRWTRVRQDFINSYKVAPCADCGVSYQFFVMQFDHVRGEKKFNISQSGSRSLEVIRREIEKCDLVCANCHMARTYKRKIASILKGDSDGRG